jgi:pimeloyl-ACP methyl ester carboxylesterase
MDLALSAVSTALNGAALISPRAAGAAAYALFCRPPGHKKPNPAQQDVMDTATLGELSVAGKSVVTYRWGSGERPVLLVHGWGSDASRLTALVGPLQRRGFTPVSFDAPGHGRSGGKTTMILEFREIIRQLQEDLGVFSGIVGYSFGSMCSFFAVREGIRTDCLISLAGVSRFDHLVTGFVDQLGVRPVFEAELRRRVETQLFPTEHDIWNRFSSLWEPDQLDVDQILVVHDKADRRAGVEQAYELTGAYGPRVQLLITEGLSHRKVTTDPAVIDRIAGFIAENSPATGSNRHPSKRIEGKARS